MVVRSGTVITTLLQLGIAAAVSTLLGCAIQTPPVVQKEAPQPVTVQRAAQQAVNAEAPAAPTLKRKIALGNI